MSLLPVLLSLTSFAGPAWRKWERRGCRAGCQRGKSLQTSRTTNFDTRCWNPLICDLYPFVPEMSSQSANTGPNRNETIARSLMGAVGQACKVTGLALSATSTLYFTHALTAAGVAVIEFLPVLAIRASTSSDSTNFPTHMAARAVLGWNSAFWLGMCLLAGITLRKTGTGLSDDRTIARAERFLYGSSSASSAVAQKSE